MSLLDFKIANEALAKQIGELSKSFSQKYKIDPVTAAIMISAGATGGVVDKTMPIEVSNVALVDANGKPSRVGIKVADGKKVRYLKTTGATLAA